MILPYGGKATGMTLFTIGHSNHPLTRFFELLQSSDIRVVVDVRSLPLSRHSPQYNRDDLQQALASQNIRYVYSGDDLGGRPEDPTCYKSGELPGEEADYLHEVDYPEVMKREWFLSGISRLLAIARIEPTAIMCSEENPAQCHRHHLIVKHLLAAHPGVEVRHIRGDGVVFPARMLLASVDQPASEQLSLF